MKKILINSIIILLAIVILASITWKIANSRTFQLFGDIVPGVNTNQKVVALTFDDGPTEKSEMILKILDEAKIKATFFLNGYGIEKLPQEAKLIVSAGHQVGNHTYSHQRMVFKSLGFIQEEIEKTDKLIRDAGYKDEIQFRPPNCKKLVLLPYYLNQHNRKTITWDIEPNTYPEVDKSSDNIVKYVLNNVNPGSIILLHPMHDSKGTTINAIKRIIEGLKLKGYTFKTVNELLELSN